ncbi:MAG TPA: succinyl-diaminopimelate desuccinylase [Acidimicrobiales bacterium]|nr:succinyl-diaminopimelate desuccinylase [Acidimicrobiales bacterium]
MVDLLATVAELVGVPSVSGQEDALADLVEQRLRACAFLEVERIGATVVARSSFGRSRRLLLAGHLDTVPPFGAVEARLEHDAVSGLGAVDMKGGLAVMLSLADDLESAALDATLCFYACEEVERDANALFRLASTRPEVLAADAAVLGEPTGGVVEAGCQGTMRAEVRLRGRRAHTARPFTGSNAIHRLLPVLDALGRYSPRPVDLDGCRYTEQLQAVRIEGGVAGNVVPDVAVVTVNYRFAPDRDVAAAEDELRSLFAPGLDEAQGDELVVIDSAAGATPGLTHPLLGSLVEASGAEARAKVGWTDVATIAALGIPATNFGPGDPLLAHTPDERVSRQELEHARRVLAEVLGLAR